MDLDHQGCAGSGQPTAFLPEEALNGLDQDWNVLTSHVKPGPVKQGEGLHGKASRSFQRSSYCLPKEAFKGPDRASIKLQLVFPNRHSRNMPRIWTLCLVQARIFLADLSCRRKVWGGGIVWPIKRCGLLTK